MPLLHRAQLTTQVFVHAFLSLSRLLGPWSTAVVSSPGIVTAFFVLL